MSRTALFTKTNIVAVVVAVVLAATGVAIWTNKFPEQPQPSAAQTAIQQTSPAEAESKADYVSYSGEAGKNALELLNAKADVKTKTSSYGELVESINGEDGGGKKYWTFYVNGEIAQVGAGAYETKNTDRIEWKLQ